MHWLSNGRDFLPSFFFFSSIAQESPDLPFKATAWSTVQLFPALGSTTDMALSSVQVLELAGKYPSSLCGMILADFGARVIRIAWDQRDMFEFVNRGKQSLALNLNTPEGAVVLEKLVFRLMCWSILSPVGCWARGNCCQRTCCRRTRDSSTWRFPLEWSYPVSIPKAEGTISTFWLYLVCCQHLAGNTRNRMYHPASWLPRPEGFLVLWGQWWLFLNVPSLGEDKQWTQMW